MNRKTLLNHIFILKPILVALKREASTNIHSILNFILALTQIVYKSNEDSMEVEEAIENDQQ